MLIDENQLRAGLLLIALIMLYLLPMLIATIRNHHNGIPIALINIFFGWTFIGWWIALIWSLTSPAPNPSQVIIQQDFSERYARPAWEHDQLPRRPTVILPPAQLPDHLFDKNRREDE